MGKPLRVLVVEDSEEDSLLIIGELERGGYDTTYRWIETPEEMTDVLEKQTWDIVFADYRLRQFSAPHALEILQQTKIDLPFIVVSGQVGEEAAAEIMREGANDFLVKGNLKRLAAVVERELQEAEIRKESKLMQEDLLIAEQSFRNSLDNSPLGIRIVTPEGDLLYANQAILGIFGYSSVEEYETTPDKDRLTPESYVEHQQRVRDRKAGNPVPTNYEVEIVRKDNEIRYLLVSRKAVVWMGEVQYQVLYQDITERKQLEALYTTIARSSPIGVYIAKDNKFRFINPQFLDYTGYTEDELMGTHPIDLIHPDDRKRIREEAIQMLKGKREAPYEFRIIHRNGETKWAMETITSIIYEGRRAVLGNFMDITERKRFDEQLIVTNHLASIGELASGIAHELNNPLTAVIGFSELLLSMEVPDNIREDLEVINREAQRTSRVVKNLLTFARGHPETKEWVNINDVIKTVLELRDYEQRVNNIKVNVRLADGLPVILSDGFQLQQVFLNIIINAEYFMNDAHGRGNLDITTEYTGKVIRVSFSDDGPGISQDDMSHLFNPFFTTKEVGRGTGLGLSISYGIVTQHGGIIYAENNQGEGATFTVELPVPTNSGR